MLSKPLQPDPGSSSNGEPEISSISGLESVFDSMARATSSISEMSLFSTRPLPEMRSIAWSVEGGYAGDVLGVQLEWLPVENFSLMGLAKIASSCLRHN